MEKNIEIPEGVEAEVENGTVQVSSGDSSVDKELDHQDLDIQTDNGDITVSASNDRRDVKALMGTYESHIKNMVDGVTEGFEYHMKGFYSHFPMDMKVEGDRFVISNFIGERSTREVDIPGSVDIQIDGEDVILSGPDKDAVGQTAANIEQACHKGDRDPRKFQDGIYITDREVKAGE
ncbi:MAG: 50S ribosomal protein L6 [Candidatus Nanohaloarchaeota archaeon QJJ-7]|nr:50S ribosomal protein L6 [Candidatus Nanohaloarchaeota archaeon QJJ-7]